MKEIGARFSLDLALMPVTTFRIPMTMGEKSAALAVEALSPRAVVPIHLSIQPRSPLLRTGQTAEGFSRRVRDAGLKTEVIILREGESWTSQEVQQ
jgi:L-ascorbate metabolism protein UlaG (beta-lactamase superfamily)